MKKKVFSLFCVLSAMALAACGGTAESKNSAAAPASKAPTSKAPTSKAPQSKTPPSNWTEPTSRTPTAGAPLTVLERNYTEGTPAQNLEGKEYIPLNDATNNKAGVKIKVADFNPSSTNTIGSDGKCSVQSAGSYVDYWIKAPKAGAYQMVVSCKFSSTGAGFPLNDKEAVGADNDRGVTVKLNSFQVDIAATRTAEEMGLNTSDYAQCVLAPVLDLTGGNDMVSFENPYYRFVFDLNSYIIFQEI